MKSLRVQLAVTLVIAILFVVALATIASFLVIRRIEGDEIGARIARQVIIATPLFESAQAGALKFEPQPAGGAPDQRLTTLLQQKLRDGGSSLTAIVSRPGEVKYPVASVQLESGWIRIPISELGPPPGAWIAIFGWMMLIGVGTIGVALMFAHIITRHLAILERVAATIGTDGTLPLLPERGPPEVRITARALNIMSARLKAAAESRMRLVAAAGHDLRTPMTRMRLRAEFLDEDERKTWLADLQELDHIADSAIQLVREESQGEIKQPLRVDRILAEICQDLKSMDSAVTINGVVPATILSAPLALTRALRNLIINAATHGGGAFVTVTRQDKRVVITIEDDGPGIPEHSMSRVFEPFFRVDPARRKSVPGAGLGLAIAKEIIERYDGELVLRNRTPKGLRQQVRFTALSSCASSAIAEP